MYSEYTTTETLGLPSVTHSCVIDLLENRLRGYNYNY
jgi:hypothetical protein